MTPSEFHARWLEIRVLDNDREIPAERRRSWVSEVTVGGAKVFLGVGEYAPVRGVSRPCEVFLDIAPGGGDSSSTLRAFANCWAIGISLALQHGASLERLLERYLFARFEPAGLVIGSSRVKMATSIVDYVARELAIEYLGREDLDISLKSSGEDPL